MKRQIRIAHLESHLINSALLITTSNLITAQFPVYLPNNYHLQILESNSINLFIFSGCGRGEEVANTVAGSNMVLFFFKFQRDFKVMAIMTLRLIFPFEAHWPDFIRLHWLLCSWLKLCLGYWWQQSVCMAPYWTQCLFYQTESLS